MFFARERELQQLRNLEKADTASLAIVYGRRRTGKTTLIEHAYSSRNLIKIEGVEGKNRAHQLENFIDSLKPHFNSPLLQTAKPSNWQQAFKILAALVREGTWTVYLEELQWMAEYTQDLIAELKPVWDNEFRRNPKLIFILCGSAPSFFISQVIRSQALYNRSILELKLEEFGLEDARNFLPNYSKRSFIDAYLSVGGIPIYLERLKASSSVYLSLCEQSFRKNSFFVQEFDKVFVSSFGKNPTYRAIVDIISNRNKVTRSELLKALKVESSGAISKYLIDLEECGFIQKVFPIGKTVRSLLSYYQINDPYLHFYYQFIEPNLAAIRAGDFEVQPTRALDARTYAQWLGFAFEKLCRSRAEHIAAQLGFSAVKYRAGALFNRGTILKPGLQVDLLFDRADKVRSVCEIRYTEAPVGLEVIAEMEKKIVALQLPERASIQRVLISAAGITPALEERHYFDRVLGLDDI